ncbi:MAG: aminoglycoside 6-adenylyltransferase [Oscillospiraceae bacterium]|nr:aminoglycoside 6-adenylyltransferase [Oscillospiraceae bacterium]
MRSEKEMFDLLLNFAKNDERIRAVGMEGSRTNINVPKDDFQDYDITYIVTDMDAFTKNDDWLDIFGIRIIMQKPEAMDLFPPEIDGFSYLMIFEDDIKIDLKILPLELLNKYLKRDKLLKILLDKDGLVPNPQIPTDEDYWIYKPPATFFDDCCNEFWHTSTYVAIGLFRDELLFASYHMEQIVRAELLRMLSWKIGVGYGYGFSVGKHSKYIKKYLSESEWDLLMRTYRMDSAENCWAALESAHILFRQASHYVADNFGYTYPDYDVQITNYINKHKNNKQ